MLGEERNTWSTRDVLKNDIFLSALFLWPRGPHGRNTESLDRGRRAQQWDRFDSSQPRGQPGGHLEVSEVRIILIRTCCNGPIIITYEGTSGKNNSSFI